MFKSKKEVVGVAFDYEVSGVHVLSDTVAVFNLKLTEGLTLYGMRLIDSAKGMFLTPAQASYKNKSGETKYSNNYYIGFSEDDEKHIIELVLGQMK